MVKYTVTVCNYNMGDTIKEAVKSILDNTNEKFEILIVDDASTDNSMEVIKKLSESSERVRYLSLPEDDSRKLGRTRNISVQEARGDYILSQLDADDRYEQGIIDFVKIFHEIESEIGSNFYLRGRGIELAQRDFLMDYGPFRNLEVGGEDRDLWRRLLADNNLISLQHQRFSHEIKDYKENRRGYIKRDLRVKIADFRAGVNFWSSYLCRIRYEEGLLKKIYEVFTLPITYIVSLSKNSYTSPKGYRSICQPKKGISEIKMNLEEIEEQYDVKIDRDVLSKEGKNIFLQ